jgi:hypothetical protein
MNTSDVDDLRRSIGEAAALIAAAIIYAGSPRLEEDPEDAAQVALDILSALRESKR